MVSSPGEIGEFGSISRLRQSYATRRGRAVTGVTLANPAQRPVVREIPAQRVVDIAPQILDVLDAGGKPEQVGRARRVRAFNRGAMFDNRFDPAKRRRAFPQAHPRRGRDRRLRSAADPDRQHAAEPALHLAARDIMARVMRQSGIEHGGDGRVIGEAARELHRVVRRGAHAQVEGSQAPCQKERLERMQDEAVRLANFRAREQRAPSSANESAPATTSEWPLRYLVAECITTSAPSATGRVKTGVAQVESTARAAPAA